MTEKLPKKLLRLEKHHWIAEHAPTKSYADIGGLWGTVNETVSIAKLAGAQSAAMVDIQPMGNKWWQEFDKRCAELGVKNYENIEGNICDLDVVDKIGQFDFVHCAGIIYHVSDPIQLIKNIMSVTRERFIVSSMVIPEWIKNKHGELLSPVGTSHLIPAVGEQTRDILSEYFRGRKLADNIMGERDAASLFKPDGRVRTGPWWWLFTAETLESMCRVCGATVEKSWSSKVSHSVMCTMA